MLEGVIGVVVALVILAVVYMVLKWVLSMTEIPFPTKIVNLVFGAIGLIIVLRYLVGILK